MSNRLEQLEIENDNLRTDARNATERFEAAHETLTKVVAERNELREEVGRLREALEGLRQRHGCFCELPPNVGSPDHTVECDVANAALSGKAGEGNGE